MVGNFALQDPDGKNHPIEGIVQIGRDRLNHIHLRDPMISRLHATAWVDGEKVFLQDEGSSNGTYVNGMPVGQPIALQVGDKVQLGHTTLILVDTRAGWIHEPPPPMPIEPPPPPPPQQRNLGFSLAMIGLAGLGFLACTIIAALVLGYVNDFRSRPQLPDEILPTQTPADTSQIPFHRPGPEIWSLGNGEGQILLDLILVGEAENGAIVVENCTATIETQGSGLILEDGNRAPPDMGYE